MLGAEVAFRQHEAVEVGVVGEARRRASTQIGLLNCSGCRWLPLEHRIELGSLKEGLHARRQRFEDRLRELEGSVAVGMIATGIVKGPRERKSSLALQRVSNWLDLRRSALGGVHRSRGARQSANRDN